MEGKTKMALKKEISTSKVVFSVLSLPPSIILHLKVLDSGTTTMVVVVLLVILLAMAGHSSGWYGCIWCQTSLQIFQGPCIGEGTNKKCTYKHCSIGSTFTPNFQGSFLATKNFFHTSKFFGLGEKDWLSQNDFSRKEILWRRMVDRN